MMDENGELSAEAAQGLSDAADRQSGTDEAIDVSGSLPAASNGAKGPDATNPYINGEIRTLDGEIAGDEFASDAINYQVLLGKIDVLLDRLKLDA
jgi:ankyrin repeat/BTB/POZ domain-containing protein 1